MNRRQFNVAMATACVSIPSFAADWPEKTIKMILPQAAGSGPDNIARVLCDHLAKKWGQPVIIDNKPGGQNNVSAIAAARSSPDGYTFYFATAASLVTNQFLFRQLPYDPEKDFAPVAFVARSPFAVVVSASSPLKSLSDFVARAKAGPVTLGNQGPRTLSGMATSLLVVRTGAKANLVPYVTVGAAIQNLMGGQLDALVADVAAVAPLVRQGQLRMLATTADKRLPDWAQVAAVSESIPDFNVVGWFAIVAPRDTPVQIIEKANKDISDALSDPEVVKRVSSAGVTAVSGLSTKQAGTFIAEERARWSKVVRDIGMTPE